MRTVARIGRIAAHVVAIALASGVVGACGGATSSLGVGPTGMPCPEGLPPAGALCIEGVACEYGSDPDVACDAVARCSGGQWSVRAATGTWCSTALDQACPTSYASLLQERTACAPVGTSCTYPEARCACATHCGMIGAAGGGAFWCCPDGPSGLSGCPMPRPRIGSACTSNGAVCDYGGCSGNVTLKCTDATWQPTSIACPA
jgi:hypothetical protein